MNDKYFVPDIEDLRIGYELERFTQGRIFNPEIGMFLPEEERDEEYKWRPDVIKCASDLLHIEAHTYTDTPRPFSVPYNQYVRTKYLTKEQIFNEGWKYVGKGYEGAVCYGYHKNDAQLTVWFDSPLCYHNVPVVIRITDSDGNVDYDGECKSINEFRYICKLLKI